MTAASNIQNSFNGGELSPLMLGRQDIDKYGSGMFVCYNGLPTVQGPWTRRSGTAFLHPTKFSDKATRLLPFQYTNTQTYILEFGEQYIRLFTNHGILTNTAQSVTAISTANPGVVSKTGHGYTNGDRIYLNITSGMSQLNGREVVVTNSGAGTFELYDIDGVAIDTTGYDAFVSGEMAEIFEIVTPYLEADLVNLRTAQSATTLYLIHPDYMPRFVDRVSALTWTITTLDPLDGPYDIVNATPTTLTPSAATGAITVTASSTVGINGGDGFKTTDVGRLIRMRQGSVWGYVTITGWTSTTVVSATVINTLTSTAAKSVWRLGVWSDTTGYPRCGTFSEDRLILGGAADFPNRFDGSKTGVYGNFQPSNAASTVADDDAVSFVLNAAGANVIQWAASSEKGLLIGTSDSEWAVKASSLSEAITPTNIDAKPTTGHGSAAIEPVVASNAVVFVQNAGRKLREMAFVFEADSFKAPDMTVLAEHITRPSITELAYQEQPQAVIWSVRSDGVLLGFTYERDQNVTAWHRHELGGQSDAAGLLIPVVTSVATASAPDGSRDELYLVVQRYINGAARQYIEYMTKLWEVGDEQEDAFYADAGWTVVNGSPSDTVDGLWHLEGETVGVYVDGTSHPDVTVTNGKATLTKTGTVVTLGYHYQSDGQSMPLEGGTLDGSAQGKKKRIHRFGMWLVDTLGIKFGPSADKLTEFKPRVWGAAHGSATPLFTGVIRERFEGTHDRLGQVYWRADGPFPAVVAAIMPQAEVSDET